MAKWFPSWHEVVREGIIVLTGTLLAAFVISRVPAVKKLVEGNSITVKNQGGEVLY